MKAIEYYKMNGKGNSGFTLLELMVVLAIIIIMVGIVAPTFIRWLPNMRLKSAARDLYSDLQQARVIAVNSNKTVAVKFDVVNNNYSRCDDWVASTPSVPAHCGSGFQILCDFNNKKSGIGYGYGSAVRDVLGGTALNDAVNYPSDIALFTSKGLGGNAGYIYLENQESATSFAVGSSTNGVIRLLKWTGREWK